MKPSATRLAPSPTSGWSRPAPRAARTMSHACSSSWAVHSGAGWESRRASSCSSIPSGSTRMVASARWPWLHAGVASSRGISAPEPLTLPDGGSCPHLSLHAARRLKPGLQPGVSSRPSLAERPEPEQTLDDSMDNDACCLFPRLRLAPRDKKPATASAGTLLAGDCPGRDCGRGPPSVTSGAFAACENQPPGAGGTPCIVAASAGAASS